MMKRRLWIVSVAILALCAIFSVGCASKSSSKPAAVYYTIVADANGGKFSDGDTKKSFEVLKDDKANVPDPLREDYDFTGWYTDKAATSKVDFKSMSITADGTYYAGWSQNAFTVTYNLNYAGAPDGGVYKTEKISKGSKLDQPTNPHRDGYDFVKWTRDPEGTDDWTFATYTVQNTTNLYAQWALSSTTEVLTGITVTTKPTKLSYVVNEQFDTSGMVVTAHYDGAADKTVTDYQVSQPDMSTSGTKTITVTYKFDYKDYFDIYVSESILSDIEITSEPTKKSYFVGETLDTAGMVVKAVYENGTKEEITDTDYTTEYDFSQPNDAALVTVKYSGKEKSFTVEVKAIEIESVTVSGTPNTFKVGDTFVLDGLTFTGHKNNGATTEIDASEITIEACSALDNDRKFIEHGNIQITFKYGTLTVTPSITVVVEEADPIDELTDFIVEGALTKAEYDLYEKFEPAGLTFYAVYSLSGNVEVTDVDEITFTGEGLNSAGTLTAVGTVYIYASYGGFTAEYVIEVTVNDTAVIPEDELEGLRFEGTLEKSNYYVGEKFSATGLTFYAVYSLSGDIELELDDVTFTAVEGLDEAYNLTKSGTITITAVYEGFEATEKITVKVTVPVTLAAGYYILGSFNGWNNGTVEQLAVYKLIENLYDGGKTLSYSTEVALKLSAGDEFKIVKYTPGTGAYNKDTGWDWDGFIAPTKFNIHPAPALTLIVESVNNNISVSNIANANIETWYLEYLVKSGTDGTKTYELTARLKGYEGYYDDMRSPVLGGATPTEDKTESAAVYIRGNFTGDFATTKDWSNSSTVISVTKVGNVYTFNKVYLKEYDSFKVYVKSGTKWWGISSNTVFTLGSALALADADDICVGRITAGYYDIIFDSTTGSETVTVRKHIETYTVTFDKNISYDASTPDSQRIVEGELVMDPSSLRVNGYTFLGWYKEAECLNAWDFDQDVVTENITLYAGWASKTINIIYDNIENEIPNGVWTAENAKNGAFLDFVLTETEGQKEHYIFVAWTLNGRAVTSLTHADIPGGTGNTLTVIITASYTGEKFAVSFEDEEGETFTAWAEGYTAPTEHEYGIALPLPVANNIVVTEGYTFLGWYKKGDESKKTVSEIGADIAEAVTYVINLRNDIVSYTVTFDVNYDGATDRTSTVKVEEHKTVAKPSDPYREHYTIVGWYKTAACADGDEWNFETDTVEEDTTLYAKWAPVKYTVEFVENVANGEVIGMPANMQVAYGSKIEEPPAPSRAYYDFGGWYLDADCIDKWIFSVNVVDGPIVLYAKWTLEKYEVTFDANKPSAATADVKNVPEAISVERGSTVDKPSDPALTGYAFLGWYSDNTFATAWRFSDDDNPNTVMAPVTLYAKWVKYSADGWYVAGTFTGWGDIFENDGAADPYYLALSGTGSETIDGTVYATKTYVVSGLTLSSNTSDKVQFKIVEYAAAGNQEVNWHPDDIYNVRNITVKAVPNNPSNIIGVSLQSSGDYNIEITSYTVEKTITWTLQFTTKTAGGNTIYELLVMPDGYNDLRSRAGTAEGTPTVYLAGNFTGGFALKPEWSTNNADAVITEGKVYTFTDVTLKKYDTFKVVTVSGADQKWMGGTFTALGTAFNVAVNADDKNIYLNTTGFVDGKYNIVVDMSGTTAKVTIYKAVTLEAELNKDIYVGQTPTANDVDVYADEVKLESNKFTLVASAAVEGENASSFTVKYNGTVITVYYTAKTLEVESISVELGNDEYELGEAFTLEGATVTLRMNDGSTRPVSDLSGLTVMPDGVFKTIGDEIEVTITHSDSGKSTTVTVKVVAATITFITDGTPVAPIPVTTYGQVIEKPISERDGYELEGWYLDGSDTAYDFSVGFTGSATLTAKWTAKEYTITYHLNNGEVDDTQTQTYKVDASFTLLDPEYDHHVFVAWYTSLEEEAEIVDVDYLIDNPGDIDVYAKWSPDSHAVEFELNGGDGTAPEPETITHGETVTMPAAPSRNGYVFKGWSVDNGSTLLQPGDQTYVVEDDVVFKAIWEAEEYDVTYVFVTSDKYTASFADETQIVKKYTYGVGLTLPTAADIVIVGAGYEFKGWAIVSNPNAESTLYTEIGKTETGNKTFYAFVSDKASVKFTFDFNYDGANPRTVEVSVVIGRFVQASQAGTIPTREEYTFAGWYESGSDTEFDFGNAIMGPTTVYAKWTIKTYTVTFDPNGGTLAAGTSATVKVDHGDTVDSPTSEPRRTGYTFAGWYTQREGGETWNFDEDTITATTTIYAHWTAVEITITFDVDGDRETYDPIAVSFDSILSNLPVPEKDGYGFDGWWNGSKQWKDGDTVNVTEDFTLTARWSEILYEIEYVVNVKVGNDNVTATAVDVRYTTYTISDGDFDLPETLSGISPVYYLFDGWVDKDGNKITTVNFDMIENGKITVTATYKLKKYTVTFDPNGGTLATGTSATVEVEHGKTVAKPDDPSQKGWTFKGWNLGNTAYNFSTPVTGPITLVAQWDGEEGTYLYYTTDGTTWKAGAPAKKNENKNEYVIENVAVYNNMEFLVVTRRKVGDDTYVHAGSFTVGSDIEHAMTVTKNGNNFKITNLASSYEGSLWTIYVCDLGDGVTVGSDGALNKDAWASYIDIVATIANEKRDPSDPTKTITVPDTASTSVAFYLAGNFTNGFNISNAWSSSSTKVTVLHTGNEYTLRHVYLKKGDWFKVVVPGSNNNHTWYGGNFAGLNKETTLSSSSDQPNVYLGSLESGYYDIVFNTSTKKLTIKTYEEPTITSITVSNTKTDYKVGEPFDASKVTVTILDSDGKSHNTEYSLSGNSTETAGTITVTVTYTGTLGGEKTKTFTINVEWIEVTVKANDADGNVITLNPKYNEPFTLPAAPTKEGHTFKGWLSGSTTYEARAQHPGVTDDLTITAVWDINTYTVKFVANGIDYGTALTVNYGETVSKPATDPTPITGYTFKHWSADGVNGAAYDFNAPVTDNLTLTAVFEINKYGVKFMADGEQYGGTETVEHGSTASAPEINPTKTGYKFSHWSLTDKGEAFNFDTPITSGITLYAVFTVDNYTITYEYDCNIEGVDGEPTFDKELIETFTVEDESFDLPVPTIAGVSFVGWRVVTGPETLVGKYISRIEKGTIAEDLELVAEYTKNETVSFTFKYNYPDGAVGSMTESGEYKVNVVVGLTVTPPSNPVLDSHNFLGWFTAMVGGEEVDFDAAVEGETVVYAHWVIKTFTVEFDIAYSDVSDPNSQTVAYGGKADKPTIADRVGYTFLGWLVVGENNRTWNFDTDTVTKDIRLIANWSINKYTVTFDYDDGVTQQLQKSVTHGGTVSAPATPTRTDGYEFVEWQKDGVAYSFDTPVTGSFTLIAVWNPIEYTVHYIVSGIVDGETVSADSVGDDTHTVESPVTLPVTLTGVNKGYKFVGWTKQGSSTVITELSLSDFVDKEVTLYAKYEIIVYGINYNMDGGTNNSANPSTYKVTDDTIELQDPIKDGYDFMGWFTSADFRAGTEITELDIDFFVGSASAPVQIYAKWQKVAKVDGLYNGDTLIKAFVVSDEGKEFAAKFIKVEGATTSPLKVKIYVDDKQVTTNTNLKSGSDSNVTVSNNEFSIKKDGIYTMYYRYVAGTDGNATGVYFIRHGDVKDFVDPDIKDGDGVYVGTTCTPFVFNENNMNQVMAKEVTVTAANNDTAVDVTFKYAGKTVTLTKVECAAGITNTGTNNTVKLYSGTYNFYYNFAANDDGIAGRLWIDGEQTGGPKDPNAGKKWAAVSSANGAVVGIFKASSRTSFDWNNGYEMTLSNGEYSITRLYLSKDDTFKIRAGEYYNSGCAWVRGATGVGEFDYNNSSIHKNLLTYLNFDGNSDITVVRPGYYDFYVSNGKNIWFAYSAT